MGKRNRFNLRFRSPERSRPGTARLPRATKTRAPLPRNPFTRAFWRVAWQRFQNRKHFHFTLRGVLLGIAGFIAALVLGGTAVFAYYVRDLPNPTQLATRPITQSTQILDRNGTPLYSIHGEQNRTLVTSDNISPYIKQATVAVEDSSFYTEHGVSLRGLLRVARNKLFHTGIQGSGGSTITQQYIKNALLQDSTKTASRKIKEIILAIEVERIYSKDQILVGYLNDIPYGSNAYGVQAAAQTYFGKNAKDLTLTEAATLAAIPQAPTRYSPFGNHLDLLFGRQQYVLGRMVKLGMITQAQADAAKLATPNADHPDFQGQQNLVAPHFIFYVRELLASQLNSDPQTAERLLDQGGYTVTTSLDINLQKIAENDVSTLAPPLIKKYRGTNAALAAVDPKTGEVLAMVGSISYSNSEGGKNNFATALKQPGSSFKPFVYATLFGPGHSYHPGSTLFDLTTDFGGGYIPQDFDGKNRGPISIRDALARSLNIPAVKALALSGIKQSIETAKSLGISTLTRDPSQYGLSLVLGSGEVRPVEMAAAYSGFANGGQANHLRPILKVAKDGKTIMDHTTDQPTKAMEPEVAWQISSILSDNNARTPTFGAHNNLTLPDRPVAAKTGTTQNDKDGWTVGYTPSLSVAVWVGNDQAGKTMTQGGEAAAGPIWQKFMQDALKDKPVEQFNRPDSLQQVTLDKLSGKLPTDQTPADQRITEWLAPWQIPKDNDDVHITAKVDKATGKLATDLTPPADVVTQTYFSVHSEMPNNPNWEGPVQAWATANGGNTKPPTESDDLHTQANQPSVVFTNPTDGSVVKGTIPLTVNVGSARSITKVEFFVDSTSVGSVTASPWTVSFNMDSLKAGSHTIQAVATNDVDLTQATQITVSTAVAATDTTPPMPIGNLNGTNGRKPVAGSVVPVHLTWTNPSDADLAKVRIYQSTSASPADPGTMVKEVPATPNTTGVADIDVGSLQLSTPYWYTARPVDSSGNENLAIKKAGPLTVTP